MSASIEEFQPWLTNKLKSLNTDEGVFGSYISGILDGEESLDDKKDALQDILSEFVDNDISSHVTEILMKWQACQPKVELVQKRLEDVDIQLSKMLESSSLATTTKKEYTEEEKKIREAILSQYSQLSDNEDGDGSATVITDGEAMVTKNTNVTDVLAAQKERREQAKLESQKKKEKDKEDREKQKQLKEEKKEKRKTQKNERKR